MGNELAKRVVDVVLVMATTPVTIILAITVALAVRVRLGGPVFFVQDRPGKNGQIFRMIKFRSMTSARGADGALLPDGQRLSSFGRFLRSTSLDELPELWNVLKGEMSLVGPRPLLTQYLPLYSPLQARRHDVRPGITGWAQINGRNALTWDEKFALDVWYVDNRTLLLDLKILALTFGKVARSDGISAHGEATMLAFTGSESAGPKSAEGQGR